MTTTTISSTQLAALDTHVERLDGARWRTRDLRYSRMTMLALCGAGLLNERFHMGVFAYAVTAAGLREYCTRNGHDFNPDRPAPDGCQRCDAVACGDCSGHGQVCGEETTIHGHTVWNLCDRCDGAGVVEGMRP